MTPSKVKGVRKNEDKYRWVHARVCIRCESLTPCTFGGIVYEVCGKCFKFLSKQRNGWIKYGLYAEKVKPT